MIFAYNNHQSKGNGDAEAIAVVNWLKSDASKQEIRCVAIASASQPGEHHNVGN